MYTHVCYEWRLICDCGWHGCDCQVKHSIQDDQETWICPVCGQEYITAKYSRGTYIHSIDKRKGIASDAIFFM